MSKPMLEYVYFVREKGTDYYKVGYSHNPEQRLINLQVANHNLLELVDVIPTTKPIKLEQFVHTRLKHGYADKQHLKRGEWFYIEESWLRTLLFELKMRVAIMRPDLGITTNE